LKPTHYKENIYMNELIQILTDLHDDVDFTTETGLIENGILNSLDIVSIITEVSDRFDVTIPAEEIMPENFDSAEALWALICRLDED
jgi:acyl carrier protein